MLSKCHRRCRAASEGSEEGFFLPFCSTWHANIRLAAQSLTKSQQSVPEPSHSVNVLSCVDLFSQNGVGFFGLAQVGCTRRTQRDTFGTYHICTRTHSHTPNRTYNTAFVFGALLGIRCSRTSCLMQLQRKRKSTVKSLTLPHCTNTGTGI